MEQLFQPFRLPLRDPVVEIALAMVIFFAAPLLFKWLRLPVTVALIAAGAALGPNGLGWMARDDTIILLGTVGLLYLMFIAAIEIDLHDFSRNRNRSLAFGALGFFVPLILGTVAGRALGYPMLAAFLLGAMLSSHTYAARVSGREPAWNREEPGGHGRGRGHDHHGPARAADARRRRCRGGRQTDGCVLVAVRCPVRGVRRGRVQSGAGVRLMVSGPLGIRRRGGIYLRARGAVRVRGARAGGRRRTDHRRVSRWPGAQPSASGEPAAREPPDVRRRRDLHPLLPAVRWHARRPARGRFGWANRSGLCRHVSDGARGEMDRCTGDPPRVRLLAGRIGRDVRVVGATSGRDARHRADWLPVEAVRHARPERDDSRHPGDLLARTLAGRATWPARRAHRTASAVPADHVATADSDSCARPRHRRVTLDFSLLLRTPGSKEPLLPIAVVSGLRAKIAARVASAEKMLSHAVMYATGAGVTAVPLTRVARAFAAGIVRGITESRATTIVTSWSGTRTRRMSVLTDELDELLAQTKQLVIVTRLTGPLNIVQRVVLVLPRGGNRSPGFDDALRVVKLVTNRLSAELLVYVVGGSVDDFRDEVHRIRPHVPEAFEQVPDWGAVTREIESRSQRDDLVILLGERHGTVGWERELDHMPARFSQLAQNFCVLYPCMLEGTEPSDDHVLTLLAEARRADRITAGLSRVSLEAAVEEMLGGEFAPGSTRLQEAVTAVSRGIAENRAEVAPGVLLVLAHLEEVATPLLFLGTSPRGLRLPHSERSARAVVLIAAPATHPKTIDAYADELRPLLHDTGRVDQLCACTTAECVAALFRSEEPSTAAPGRAA